MAPRNKLDTILNEGPRAEAPGKKEFEAKLDELKAKLADIEPKETSEKGSAPGTTRTSKEWRKDFTYTDGEDGTHALSVIYTEANSKDENPKPGEVADDYETRSYEILEDDGVILTGYIDTFFADSSVDFTVRDDMGYDDPGYQREGMEILDDILREL